LASELHAASMGSATGATVMKAAKILALARTFAERT
jgi:hypothetical protein